MNKLEYSFLYYSTNLKDVGIFEQIQDLTIPVTREVIDSYQMVYYDTFPDKIQDFTILKLHRMAKITDVLSAGEYLKFTYGFVINGKVKTILEKFNKNNFKFYDALVTDQHQKTYPYFVFAVNNTPEIIDFPASLFKKNDNIIDISSFEDLRDKEKIMGYIKCYRVVFKEKYDIARIPLTDDSILISKELKEVLTNAGVTGLGYINTTPAITEFYLK